MLCVCVCVCVCACVCVYVQPFSPFLSKAAPATESLELKKDLKTGDLFILKRPFLLLLLLLFLPLSFLTTPSLHHLQPPLIRSQYCQEIAPATHRERENRYIFSFKGILLNQVGCYLTLILEGETVRTRLSLQKERRGDRNTRRTETERLRGN